MKITSKMLLIAACFALAVSLMFTGTASAKYVGDNAQHNGATGLWEIPDDRGVCITGITKGDGITTFPELVIDGSITSRPDCIAKTFPAYTTAPLCSASDTAGADVEGVHAMVSTCIASPSGAVISLKDLDRNANMCNQRAILMGQTSGAMVSTCAAFTWTNMGESLAGTDGFCYTTVRLDNYADQAACPDVVAGNPGSGTVGYSWDSTNSRCNYSYGIQGKANAALVKKDGTGNYAAAGANVDLSTLDMAACLFNGASWSNHTLKGGDAVEATTDPANSTIASPITQVRAGCLSCHNNTTQYNSYKGRWKSDYLRTGHKNMLRKATAGDDWAGPNADGIMETYTSWGAAGINSIDWSAPSTTVGATTYPLMYIFGDWMAPAPAGLDVIVWDSSVSQAKYNAGSAYSCAACHATGWRNENTALGLCNYSSKTTQATCEAVLSGDFGIGVWTPSSGVEGFGKGGAEPVASFPAYELGSTNSIAGIAGQWDVDGIVCARCHKVAFDTSLPINDEGVHAPQGFTTHETDIFDGWKCVQTCYGCHQSVAKTANGTGLDADLNNPATIPVKDADSGPGYIPEFSGHVLGGSFLNSPHGQFTGTIVPNSLGKYDIVEGGAYAGTFVGYLCRSSTLGGGSILETNADGSTISNLAQCNIANAKAPGTVGYWQPEPGVGSCITCHNIHESLFDAEAEEPLRRECGTCHESAEYAGYVPNTPQKNTAIMTHPTNANSPFDTSLYVNACEVCHMPKATSGGFPMHLWRINTDESYSTFPTAAEFATLKIGRGVSKDGSAANAVWVDVDLACGQCHGGGASEATPAYAVRDGVPYVSKAELSVYAETIHGDKPIANFSAALATPDNMTVNVDASSSSCASGSCSYSWDFSDTFTGAGVTESNTYVIPGDKTITLTVTDTVYLSSATKSKVVTVYSVDAAPVADGCGTGEIGWNADTWTATCTDASTDDIGLSKVTVDFGYGPVASDTTAPYGPFSRTYATAGLKTITHKAYDTIGQISTETTTVTPAYFVISGTVHQSDHATTVSGAKVVVKKGLAIVKTVYTSATGTFSATNLKPGTYTLTITRTGHTFTVPAATVTVGPSSLVNDIDALTP